MQVSVTVTPDEDGDDVRSLRISLAAEEDLAGRVAIEPAAQKPGSLGGVVDTLLVSLISAGAVTAFTRVLIVWIRHQTSDAKVVMRKPDGTEVEISAQRVRGLSPEALTAMTEHMTKSIESNGQVPQ
ncbi:hypothetical protein AB0J63_08755 [Streptosporangium canum]|uniref:effector-associated constant component EACC1 n=1 Tax=Streptosporangium canum TaxID=324952 RepID=UPI0034231E9E